MAVYESGTYGDIIYGTSGADTINVYGDHIVAYGESGGDELYVDASRRYSDIEGVTLSGGEGRDLFGFTTNGNAIRSAVITDFSTSDGDGIAIISNNITTNYLKHTTNDDGDVVIRDSNDTIEFTLKGIKNFDDVADSPVIYGDYYGNVSQSMNTFEETTVPYGLTKYDGSNSLYVFSDYVGGVWLGGWDVINGVEVWGDDSITNIYGYLDTVENRILAGNTNDNYISANMYGSWLWGGFGGNDTLVGSSGADTFFVDQGLGNKTVVDCGENDLVWLWNISLSDISGLNLYEGDNTRSLDVTTYDGTEISIGSTRDTASTTVQLADGSKWKLNYSDVSWEYQP